METDNNDNIKTFTAGDIEKYHRGLLSPREAHALEKAALDDPFLADALEGYAVQGANASADLTDLKARLAERTGGKMVPIGGRPSIPWLRAAIGVGVLAGASLLTYQFFFNNKNNAPVEIAQETPLTKDVKDTPGEDSNKNYKVLVTDSTGVNNNSYYLLPDTALVTLQNRAVAPQTDTIATLQKTNLNELSFQTDNVAAPAIPKATDSAGAEFKITTPNAVSKKPDKKDEPDNKKLMDGYITTDDKAGKKRKESSKEESFAKDRRSDTVNPKERQPLYYETKDKEQQRTVTLNNSNMKKFKQNQQPGAGLYFGNTFNGRVTDASNNGLPFANVMNTQDNVGTYTDVNGRFTLVSPDSVLNVQIRSTGFDNNVVKLRSAVTDNQIVMEEDKSVAAQTLQGPRRVNYEKRRSLVLEGEPEPEDGWENYDSYLSNNVNIPEAFKPKSNMGGGQVEVSFEVNEDGEPIRIRIEKSLKSSCSSCDKEAIRLIKEGPRWKRKARRGRTTVTISF